MSDADKSQLDTCGCCGEQAPDSGLYNRPGLDALDYRIGDHGRFLARMLERLPRQPVSDALNASQMTRPLAQLATRATDDPSIAMLDAWATTLDVLTFYQERVANEGFLRTATERRSVLELANMIGYELKPGVAATTWLAFTVEGKDDPFRTATVPAGTQVLSIPQDGELPQTFETDDDIEAQAQWNALAPRTGLSQYLALRGDALYLLDIDGSLGLADHADALNVTLDGAAGGVVESAFHVVSPLDQSDPTLTVRNILEDSDRISTVSALEVEEFHLQGTGHRIAIGDQLLLVGRNSANTVATRAITVTAVSEDKARQTTRVGFGAGGSPSFIPVFTLPLLVAAAPTLTPLGFSAATVSSQVLKYSWTQSNLSVAMQMNQWSGRQLQLLLQQPPRLTPGAARSGIFVLREKSGFFGHNAQAYATLVAPEGSSVDTLYPVNWDNVNGAGAPISIWQDPNKDPDTATDTNYTTHDCYLERGVKGLVADSWVVVRQAGATNPKVYQVAQSDEVSLTGFALSAKTTGLRLAPPGGSTADLVRDSSLKVRTATLYSNSEALAVADIPLDPKVDAGTAELMLDGLVLDLAIGQAVAVSGERSDAPGVDVTEIRLLAGITHYAGFTVLEFEEGLDYGYRRDTLRVNANVAPASHGETVDELLGSGDAAQGNQQFTLRKSPLTFTSASTPSGIESSLSVRVNGVEWEQADALYREQHDSERYNLRVDHNGKTNITFGDGQHGARLPSGQLNVTATYRQGIGLAGEVAAQSLTLLKKRPAGITAVVNPEAASGAEDPETRDDARVHAPQTVRTLDRIVSLRDFEDFAMTFAGIGKAQAVPIWTGEAYRVHVTLATANGKTVDADSDLMDKLRDAMDAVRDPTVEIELEGFQGLYFNVVAAIKIDDRYLFDAVRTRLRSRIEDAFSFARRRFGQPVTAAEIIALVQSEPGVVYVDLDALYTVVDGDGSVPPTPAAVLPAMPAQWNATTSQIDPAQLLLVSQAGITIVEISDE